MSILSSVTGIGINPFGKTKVKINPMKALGTALTVGSMGGLGGIGAVLGRIPGAAAAAGALKAVPGVTALGAGAAKAGGLLGKIPGASKLGGVALHGFGGAGQAPAGVALNRGQPTDMQGEGPGTPPPFDSSIAGAPSPTSQSSNSADGGTDWGNVAGQLTGFGSGTQGTQPTQPGLLSQIGGFLSKPGVAQAGADIAGGVLQGQSQAAQLKAQGQQFNRTQGLTEANDAAGMQRQQAASPLRDQALYMLKQRMGMPTQQFKPHDIYNQSYGSGPAQMGGIDQNALNQKNAQYTPGAGGVNQALYAAYIKKYGGLS